MKAGILKGSCENRKRWPGQPQSEAPNPATHSSAIAPTADASSCSRGTLDRTGMATHRSA